MQEEVASFRIDWNGPLPTDEDVEIVQVMLTRNPLDEMDYTELQQTIDPCQFVLSYFKLCFPQNTVNCCQFMSSQLLSL